VAGQFSFPSFAGTFKRFQYPDITLLRLLVTGDWQASLSTVLLLRDPAELVLSTVRRSFGSLQSQLGSLEFNSRVLLTQLVSLPHTQWVCWDFHAEAHPQCSRIAQHLGVTVDLCSWLAAGRRASLARAVNRTEAVLELGTDVLKQMDELYTVYFAMRQLCLRNNEVWDGLVR
jgi:hypothetical protein